MLLDIATCEDKNGLFAIKQLQVGLRQLFQPWHRRREVSLLSSLGSSRAPAASHSENKQYDDRERYRP